MKARSGKAPLSRFITFRDLGLMGVVLGATFITYLPALGGEFIWNDSDYVTAPALRSLAGLGAIWFRPGATEQYYPLLHSFFWLQCQVFGDQALGYHIVTLLLHSGAAILFALILRRLAVPGAWLAALLFALHPVHVESVAWITEQKNTLSLVCYLAAALVYLDYDATRRRRVYYAAFGLFVCSLLCKTVTATLPAALLVVFWWQRGRLEWRRDIRPLLAWLVAGAGAGLFSSWVEQHFLGAKGADFDLPLLERGLVAGRAVFFYLQKVIWPFGLNFVYPRWTPDAAVWWQWLFPLGVIALAGALWRHRDRSRAPLAAFLLFIGSLFPVLGFVKLYGAHYSWVWDHWQYLADLAPLALAGVALARAGDWAGPRFRSAGPVAGLALCVLFGALTWERCGDFHNAETLYRATLARNPDCWMAHQNLGLLLHEAGQNGEAIEHFERALQANPAMPDAHTALGIALEEIGRRDEAVTHYERALQLDANFAVAHSYLGLALARAGKLPEAIAHYEAALRLRPDLALTASNLGNALCQMDRLPEAIERFEQALRIDPALPEVHSNLGAVLLVVGRTPEAIVHFQQALQLNPNLAQVHLNLATALENVGRKGEAAVHYEAARRLGLNVPPPAN